MEPWRTARGPERLPLLHGADAGPRWPTGRTDRRVRRTLPLSFNMTWTPHGRWMRLHESLFPERHRVARAISESGRLATVVAERGSVTDALHAIWDELTSLSS